MGGAQFGAEFEAVHAGHIHIEEDEVELLFGERGEGGFGIIEAGGGKPGFVEGVDDGAAGDGFVVHDQYFGPGLSEHIRRIREVGVFHERDQEINGGGDGAEGGGVDIFRLFEEFLQQGFEGVGQLGDLVQAGDAGVAREGMDAAIQFLEQGNAFGFIAVPDEVL